MKEIVRPIVSGEYYSSPRLNKSNLAIFLSSPYEYKRQIDGLRPPLEGAALEEGTMVHKYILENDDFFNDYYLARYSKPNKSINQTKFVQRLLEEHCYDSWDKELLLTIYKECYNTQKQTYAQALENAEKAFDEVADYISELVHNPGKLPVSTKQFEKLNRLRVNVFKHPIAKELLGEKPNTFSEFHVEFDRSEFECKALMDRVIFLPDKKVINLVDLKTTHALDNFNSSIKSYTYVMQLEWYRYALREYLRNELGENPEEWTIDTWIVAVDKETERVKVYRFTKDCLDRESTKTEQLLTKLHWHYDNDQWEMDEKESEVGYVEYDE